MKDQNIVVCHHGHSNDPTNWFNWVDINCIPYTLTEVTFFATGCLMWIVAYAIMLRNAYKFKFIEMAAIAGASNFAWEILWGSFFYQTDMGLFLVWTYRAWLLFDLFIFYKLVQYGHKQYENKIIRKNFKWLCCLVAIFFFGVYYFLGDQGYETPIGSVSAYICQFVISILCLVLIIRRPNLHGFSGHVAWLRCFGTGLVSVFMFLHYPHNHFVHWLCLWSWICDCCYMYIFWKRWRIEKQMTSGVLN